MFSWIWGRFYWKSFCTNGIPPRSVLGFVWPLNLPAIKVCEPPAGRNTTSHNLKLNIPRYGLWRKITFEIWGNVRSWGHLDIIQICRNLSYPQTEACFPRRDSVGGVENGPKFIKSKQREWRMSVDSISVFIVNRPSCFWQALNLRWVGTKETVKPWVGRRWGEEEGEEKKRDMGGRGQKEIYPQKIGVGHSNPQKTMGWWDIRSGGQLSRL